LSEGLLWRVNNLKTMTTTQLKNNLHKYIDRADERFLSAIYAMMSEYMKTASPNKKNEDEDYTKPGKPMSLDTLKKRIIDAQARVAEGKYISQEDLEKEMKNW